MELQRRRRTREIPGHTPNAVGILARATLKKPVESLILENRKKDELSRQVEAEQKEAQKLVFKNEWEVVTDKRIKQSTINRRVEGILQHDQFHLERRREKLRKLLAEEEQQQLVELESRQETTVERQAKMRERATMLREKREKERQALAQEKMDQRWRLECEELRSTMSKRNTDMVCRERDAQLREKEFIREQEHEEERMFANQWAADHRLKALREEAECAAAQERNVEQIKTLNLQKAALEEKQRQEVELKEQEKKFVEEQIALRKMEEEHRRRDKLRLQKERARDLTRGIKQKMKLQAKEVQEELALDIKLLQQILMETSNEAEEAVRTKKRLHSEMMQYMTYLKEEAEREKQREKELDRMLQVELDKDFRKVVNKWREEQAARARLLREVMETRQQQIAEKLEINRKEQEEAAVERQRLNDIFQEHVRMEKEDEERRKRVRKKHQSDLLDQLDYQTALKEEEEHMTKLELDEVKRQEQRYRDKLGRELAKEPFADQRHPLRQAMTFTGGGGGTFNF
ncbi:cilia- and flagella-associated protein 53-like [Sycon ciliatum]|uniref:cilia- and flagella-associated protein 53-like n=1 Tax=Sycon ciliatum TaxID=27933 RepID=UPI0031F66F40|eukprot:scpid45367/ scgid7439/ Coiled-coil domain-containing protein 11